MVVAMLIRRMTPADADAVAALIGRSYDRVLVHYHSPELIARFREHATPESLLEQLGRKEVYVVEGAGRVVDDAGRIIATGGLGWFHDDGPSGDRRISDLFVAVDLLGHGVGRILLDHLVQLARTQDAPALRVASSRNAVGFYERAGFHIDAVPPTTEEPEITWMTRRLQP